MNKDSEMKEISFFDTIKRLVESFSLIMADTFFGRLLSVAQIKGEGARLHELDYLDRRGE